MSTARRSPPVNCNLNAAVLNRCRAVAAALLIAVAVAPCAGQEPASDGSARRPEHGAGDGVKFFAGAALALAMHETGHLVFDVAFDARPHLEPVSFGPLPFVAIAHRPDLSPRREFTISSAGFWVQEATDEWLLTTRPDLRHERAPLAKGMLAFNVVTSMAYAWAAMAKVGPYERDTRGMADSIGVPEPTIGLLVLAPAVFDTYRYLRPDSGWARWASRATKLFKAGLVVK